MSMALLMPSYNAYSSRGMADSSSPPEFGKEKDFEY